MNRYNFLQTGGFPFETDILDGMQKAYEIFNSLGALAGNFTIISGCIATGSNISNGFVHINGEIYPFVGGAAQTTVVFQTTIQSAEFEDLSTRDIQEKKHVQFGTGVGSMLWADFTRPETTTQLTTLINDLIERVEDLEALPQATPVGLVAIWGLPANAIPTGWVEHIPLRGRFPIGQDVNYDSNTNGDLTNYNLQTLDYAGGKREHQLTTAEMPAHNHNFNSTSNGDGGGYPATGDPNEGGSDIHMNTKGGDKAHTNMSPYRVVNFIRYVG